MKETQTRSRLPVYLRWIGWVLLAQFILLNISAAFYAHKFTHVSNDPSLRNAPPSRNILVKTWRLFSGPRQARSVITNVPSFTTDSVVLRTAKGVVITAWYGKPDSTSAGTVILLHGIGSNKGMVLNEAEEFMYLGYSVLLVDLRAHGNSGGQTTTLGVRESEEVKLAYDHIAASGEKNIFLWGSSMGAVIIAKAIANYDLHPAGVMLEAPFASLQTHLQGRARVLGFKGFPEKPFGFLVSWWIGVERGFNGHRHRTFSYVKEMKCPVLLQWGGKDQLVLKKETEKVFEAIASTNKKLVVFDRAGHESLLQNDPVKWRIETSRFLSVNGK